MSNILHRVVVVCVLVTCTMATAQGPAITPLLFPDKPISSLGPGVACVSSGVPVINEVGTVLVVATVGGTGVTTANDRVLFAGPPGALVPIARTGDPVAGLPPGVVLANGANFATFARNYVVDDTGMVGFTSGLSGVGVTTTNDVGVFVGTPGNIALVSREGDPAPGQAGGVTIDQITGMAGNAGKVSVFGTVLGPGVTSSNDGINFIGPPLMPGTFVMREGEPIVGLPTHLGSTSGIPVTRNGDEYFTATRAGAPATSDLVLVRRSPSGVFTEIVREGDPAPTLDPSVTIGPFTQTSIANNVALITMPLLGNVTAQNNEMVVVGGPGNWTRVIRKGDQALGMPTGVTYDGVVSSTIRSLNDVGDFTMSMQLFGPGIINTSNDTALYAWRNGQLELLIREGDPIDALGGGVNYSAPSGVAAVNNAGRIALRATLAGPNVTTSNNSCMMAEGLDGEWLVWGRRDSSLDFGGGEEVLNLHTGVSSNGSLGLSSMLNSDNELVLHVTINATSGGGSASYLALLDEAPRVSAWTIPPAAEFNTNSGVNGTSFEPRRDIEVVKLGYYDDLFGSGEGLNTAHPVGIYHVNTMELVVQATVPAGTAAPRENLFRYVDVPPTRLLAGEEYIVAAVSNGDNGHNVLASSMSVGADIILGTWRSGGAGPTLSYPNIQVNSAARFMGPSFQYRAAPDVPACPADLDNDGSLANGGTPDGAITIDDLLFFLNAFEAGDVAGDLDGDGVDPANPDGAVTIDDLLFFLVHFEAGC